MVDGRLQIAGLMEVSWRVPAVCDHAPTPQCAPNQSNCAGAVVRAVRTVYARRSTDPGMTAPTVSASLHPCLS